MPPPTPIEGRTAADGPLIFSWSNTKSFCRHIFDQIKNPLDLVFSLAIVPAAYVLLLYRRLGSYHLPQTTARLRQIGVFPIRNHYYEPLFDHRQLQFPLSDDRMLPGLDLNVSGQLGFLERLSSGRELADLHLDLPNGNCDSFSIHNDNFGPGDAEFLYQFIRAIKPQKIIEIGSGHSTKIANLALQKNVEETNKHAQHVCVEPYEQPWLERLANITVIRRKIEDCEFGWAKELESGDFLFVDSSHIIRPQGDVLKEYLEIFPQLSSGVYVHVHDICTPRDYLKPWLTKHVRLWNEQYLLEVLLGNSSRYEIIAALNYLKHNHGSKLQRICPYLAPEHEPLSFYFKVR